VEAVAAWRAAIVLAPEREEYRAALAMQLIRHLSFQSAIEALRSDLAQFPKSARLRTLLGIAQYASGETADAVESLSGAIAADPASDAPYRCLTQILLQSSAAPARPVIAQLCGWNRTVCHALNLRLARENQDAVMQAEAVRGLEQGSDNVARCELARAREWTGRLPEARTEMEACVAADPSPQNHYRLGLIYQRLGLIELARKQMEVRSRTLQTMSDQTSIGLRALESLK
jgi:tetratricopeptide (TPR) repeat protein